MLRAALFSLLLLIPGLPAWSQGTARIDPLYRALGLPEIVAIMRQEGIDYGQELAGELFAGQGGQGWSGMVDEIYRLPRLEGIVRDRLAEILTDQDLAPMLAFFDSDLGRRIVGLEISARRALLDPDVDAASRAALADLIGDDDPRLDLIETFSEVNTLVENNVVGAMNSNFAFYRGLSEGGAFGAAFSQDDMLADVWSQEQAIRDETTEWLYSYLMMAYRPLSDAELAAYIAFSETPEGAALNQAIFDAFDEMFVTVSLALGHAAARYMSGEQL